MTCALLRTMLLVRPCHPVSVSHPPRFPPRLQAWVSMSEHLLPASASLDPEPAQPAHDSTSQPTHDLSTPRGSIPTRYRARRGVPIRAFWLVPNVPNWLASHGPRRARAWTDRAALKSLSKGRGGARLYSTCHRQDRPATRVIWGVLSPNSVYTSHQQSRRPKALLERTFTLSMYESKQTPSMHKQQPAAPADRSCMLHSFSFKIACLRPYRAYLKKDRARVAAGGGRCPMPHNTSACIYAKMARPRKGTRREDGVLYAPTSIPRNFP